MTRTDWRQHEGFFDQLRAMRPSRTLRLLDIDQPGRIINHILQVPWIKVSYEPDMPVSGMGHWADGHWQIIVRATDAPTRQRFTIARESKHILDRPFHRAGQTYTPGRHCTEHETTEQICDYSAGCLLTPRAVTPANAYNCSRSHRDSWYPPDSRQSTDDALAQERA
jgi:hypothetical protein